MGDADDAARWLWPLPKQVKLPRGVRLSLGPVPVVGHAGGTDQRAAAAASGRLVEALAAAGLKPSIAAGDARATVGAGPVPTDAPGRLRLPGRGLAQPATAVRLAIDPGGRPAEGYELRVDASGVTLVGADAAGLYYGAQTLAQWIALAATSAAGALSLPGVEISDHPDLAHRGVMLDISRDKVPTMAALRRLVDRLAGWKINQLQLYVEHTFAYAGHEQVWREASPLTGEQARELDAYCRERFVELVPNQNSFGHFHRWLIHDPYRQLAECPEGIDHPFSEQREPYSLCPIDPGSLQLLAGLYDQLLPNFTSRMFNVGLDETFDLGKGRSRAACEARGKHEVYLEFLQQVHRLVHQRGRRMQFWGDIIIQRPDLIDRLPEDAIALEWGYEADHPFFEHAACFARSGRPFYVCPGTSSWNSIAGRATNAVLNLARAASAGSDQGADGLLVTDWGDFGHLQPLSASYLGYLAGAGFAWNTATARGEPRSRPWPGLLDRHALADPAGVAGEVAIGLADAYVHTSAQPKNGSALFFSLIDAVADLGFVRRKVRGLTAASLAETLEVIGEARARIEGARLDGEEGALVADELRWSADLLALCCRLGMARFEDDPLAPQPVSSLARPLRLALARTLEPIIEGHRAIWLARNREGGRRDSVSRLERLRRLLKS